MKSKLHGNETDSQNLPDLSILRTPISTSVTGFIETIQAFENGTPEIRNLLANECDILYECRVCRNIFRSLANFISHKRVYCRVKFSSSHHFHFRNNGFIDQDVSTILESDMDKYSDGFLHKDKNQEIVNKDLGSIIERLMKKQQKNEVMKLTDFYDQVDQKLTRDEKFKRNHTLELDKMDNSNVAVYQTIKQKNENRDNMKKEINEVHKLSLNKNTVLDSTGKIAEIDDTLLMNNFDDNMSTENDFIYCEICNYKFDTEKMLKLHIEVKHIPSTVVYQCPTCSITFLQPAAVIKHLCNDHNKSLRKIRLMRETIYKKRSRIDEVQTKGPSRELIQLQMDNTNNIEEKDKLDLNSLCPYCGKTFERRAVLVGHINSCMSKAKTKSLNKIINKTKLKENSVEKHDNNNIINSTTIIENNNHEENEQNKKIDDIPLEKKLKINKRKRKNIDKTIISDELIETITVEPNLHPNKKIAIELLSNDSQLVNTDNNDNCKNINIIDKETTTTVTITPPPKILECDICEKKFLNSSNLKRHTAMFHYRIKNFGCKLCDFRGYRKFDIVNHIGNTHNIKENVIDNVLIYKNDDKTLKDKDKIKDKDNNKQIEKLDNNTLLKINNNINDTDIRIIDKIKNNVENIIIKKKRMRLIKPKIVPPEMDNTQIKIQASSTIVSSTIKRPIRNRIKPIQKDFVYDLSNLLKKDQELTKEYRIPIFPIKIPKRRNTLQTIDDTHLPIMKQDNIKNKEEDEEELGGEDDEGIDETILSIDSSNNNSSINSPPEVPITDIEAIKGAAFEMAKIEIINSTACFKKDLEIPPIQYVIPAKIQELRRSDPIQDLTFLKNDNLKNECKVQQLRKKLADTLRKNSNRRRKLSLTASAAGGKTGTAVIKSPNKHHNVSTPIAPIDLDFNDKIELKILETSTSEILTDNLINEETQIPIKCPTEKEFQQYLVTNLLTEPIKKIVLDVPELQKLKRTNSNDKSDDSSVVDQ